MGSAPVNPEPGPETGPEPGAVRGRPAISGRLPTIWWERLGLGVPVLLVAAVASLGTPLDLEVNGRLEQAGRQVAWGSADFGAFIGRLYPPLPVAVAGLVPGGAAWLSVAGALVGGVAVHALLERLRSRQVPGWVIAVLITGFVANPAFLQLATEDLADFVGAGLFVIALVGFLRFAVDGDTHGGFLCGLALGLAAACTPVTVLYAAFLGLAAAPVAAQRYHEPYSARAAALVVTFPAFGALAGWTFLEWRFTGSATGWLRAAAPAVGLPGEKLATLGASVRTVAIGVATSPLFVATQLLLARRRRGALVITVLAVAALVAGLWLGLRQASGYSAVLLGAVALCSVPSRPSAPVSRIVAATGVAGWIAIWLWAAVADDRLGRWTDALIS